MRFKPGQEIVCINKRGWYYHRKGMPVNTPAPGPKYEEIVVVSNVEPLYPNGVCLVEYPGIPDGYDEKCFEPIADISELVELTKSELIEA